MKTTKKTLLMMVLTIIVFGCEEKALDADIKAINVFITEDLEGINSPVCLMMNISSVDRFDNMYRLKEVVSIHENEIRIDVESMTNIGTCEYPEHLSAPEPENYKCPATTDYFVLNNLKRGIYTIKIALLNSTYNGRLTIYDQHASLIFDDSNVSLHDSVIHIVPDSCIYGTYYSMGSDSAGFQDMMNRLESQNCKQISISPGNYRDFSVDNNGRLSFNSNSTQEPTFILKYNEDIDQILSALNDFVASSNDAYGIIFNDHLGNYYNIKK